MKRLWGNLNIRHAVHIVWILAFFAILIFFMRSMGSAPALGSLNSLPNISSPSDCYLNGVLCSNRMTSDGSYQLPNGDPCSCPSSELGSLGCGDRVCNNSETCLSCPADCGACPSVCGNGIIESGETCDQGNGNIRDGDGCSSTCRIEDGWICSGEPSICTQISIPAGNGTITDDGSGPPENYCGDGMIDGNEQCDGLDLNSQTCSSLGYDGGLLSCDFITCDFNTDDCYSNPIEQNENQENSGPPNPGGGSTTGSGSNRTGGGSSNGGSSGVRAVCGNALCEAAETEENCPVDCRAPLPPGITIGEMVKDCPVLTNTETPDYSTYRLSDNEQLAAQSASRAALTALLSTRFYSITQGPPGHAPLLAEYIYQIRTGDTQIQKLKTRVPISATGIQSAQPYSDSGDGIDFDFAQTLKAGQTLRFSLNQEVQNPNCPNRPPLLLAAQSGARTGIVTHDACQTDPDCSSNNNCYFPRCIANECVLFQQGPGFICGFSQICSANGECVSLHEGTTGTPQAGDSNLLAVLAGLFIGLMAILAFYWSSHHKLDFK